MAIRSVNVHQLQQVLTEIVEAQVDEEEFQKFLDSGELRRLLRQHIFHISNYPTRVGWPSVESMLTSAGIAQMDADVLSYPELPFVPSDSRSIHLMLVRFRRDVTQKEVMAKFEAYGFRSCTLEELIAFSIDQEDWKLGEEAVVVFGRNREQYLQLREKQGTRLLTVSDGQSWNEEVAFLVTYTVP